MKTVSISGSLRTNVGKKDAKALRDAKQVPCVLYGGKEQIHFSVLESDFKKLIFTPDAAVVDLTVSDKKFNTILQATQFHALTDRLVHADFLEVVPGKAVTMSIPVKTTGASPGVRNGGQLLKKMKYISIRGLVEKMPDDITIDISNMYIGDASRIEDIKIDGLTLLSAPKNTIVSVATTRVVVEEEPETEAVVAEGAEGAEGEAAPAADGAAAPAADAKKEEKK